MKLLNTNNLVANLQEIGIKSPSTSFNKFPSSDSAPPAPLARIHPPKALPHGSTFSFRVGFPDRFFPEFWENSWGAAGITTSTLLIASVVKLRPETVPGMMSNRLKNDDQMAA
ncbi:hypothetical protein GWI33_008859 [Rhynchophorus ferrugineus]|uniref:Uncharacterized protein n=1 Tax=Rhynchophorus ferrugineus TaxID=354439 RepID=A0A834IHJ7_RHYFE|nr:hypothetical protein GWI33_008859 [Rhynchophorus ferrugineus]